MRKTKAVLPTILVLITAVMLMARAGLRPAGHRAVPGSPSAIETIDGRYLPNSPAKFGGEINVNATQSKPHWPARVVPPKGAPNILLIMTEAIRAGT